MFVVRRVEVDYLRPARLDDSLVVETQVLAAGPPRRRCARRRVAPGREEASLAPC